MPNTTQPQLNIDLTNTTGVTNFDGGNIFQQGVILRKVSRFVTGTDDDALLPIPVFYDPATKKILTDSVPKELRDELKDELV
jgi:hypothetical protein|tara:strand:- start:2394 stop:2639 length:246 start_codon:yes stop_codon:yes gene_type:complete